MKIIGHRGARGLAPENTLASIQIALANNVDELEIDLRVTKDGIVILHHDTYLENASAKKFLISLHTFSELKKLKSDLSTFNEVLETISHSVPVYLDIKRSEPIDNIINIINNHLAKGWRTSDFLIGSKSQNTLRQVHAELPNIQKIIIEPWSGVRAIIRARQVGTTRLSMNQRWLWSGFIRSMSRRGWKVAAYTLNNPNKANRWSRHGLFAVITDYPDRFNKKLFL